MLIKPLVKNNVDAFLEKGSVNALTGPVERNDISTVRKHLDVLSGDDREIYRLLGKKLVSVAQEKNQDRNYEKLKEVFMERKTTK